jgi:hypothetical protein
MAGFNPLNAVIIAEADIMLCVKALLFVCFWRCIFQWARASSFKRFLDDTRRHTTVGRTPLEE